MNIQSVSFFIALFLAFNSVPSHASHDTHECSKSPSEMKWDERTREGGEILKTYRSENAGLKILWWNIQRGALNHQIYKEHGCRPLDDNLRNITSQEGGPDILFLGEYEHHALLPETLEHIRSKFPYTSFSSYNDELNYSGIAIFSRTPILEQVKLPVDWTPLHLTTDEKGCYRDQWLLSPDRKTRALDEWGRNYERVRVEHEGQTIDLIPLHVAEPWMAIKNRSGNLVAAWNLTMGNENPLVNQMGWIRKAMAEDEGLLLKSKPVVIIGDLNVPKKLATLISIPGFEIISDGFKDAFVLRHKTFPAASSPLAKDQPIKSWGGFKIDHVLHNNHVNAKNPSVFPLQGSDHYPIGVIVEALPEKNP